jgi:hypothetical protein
VNFLVSLLAACIVLSCACLATRVISTSLDLPHQVSTIEKELHRKKHFPIRQRGGGERGRETDRDRESKVSVARKRSIE